MIAATLRELLYPEALIAPAAVSANPGSDPRAWRELIRAAEQVDAALPALAVAWEASFRAFLPELVQLRIEERLQRERLKNAVLCDELERASSVLHDARVPSISFGELDLSRRCYPRARPRGARLARLLVPVDSLGEALGSLAAAGYRKLMDSPAEDAEPGSVDLERRPSRARIRVQTELVRGEGRALTGAAWDRSIEGSDASLARTTRALAPEDCAAWTICEAVRAGALESPLLLCDLYFIRAASGALDWGRVAEALAARGAATAGWYALGQLSAAGRLPVPAEALRELERRVNPFKRQLIRSLSRQGKLPQDALLRDTLLRGRVLNALLEP